MVLQGVDRLRLAVTRHHCFGDEEIHLTGHEALHGGAPTRVELSRWQEPQYRRLHSMSGCPRQSGHGLSPASPLPVLRERAPRMGTQTPERPDELRPPPRRRSRPGRWGRPGRGLSHRPMTMRTPSCVLIPRRRRRPVDWRWRAPRPAAPHSLLDLGISKVRVDVQDPRRRRRLSPEDGGVLGPDDGLTSGASPCPLRRGSSRECQSRTRWSCRPASAGRSTPRPCPESLGTRRGFPTRPIHTVCLCRPAGGPEAQRARASGASIVGPQCLEGRLVLGRQPWIGHGRRPSSHR